jgi:hypothetical protein
LKFESLRYQSKAKNRQINKCWMNKWMNVGSQSWSSEIVSLFFFSHTPFLPQSSYSVSAMPLFFNIIF